MKARKLLAAALTGAMVFSLAGCSMGSNKYEKALKNLDYEEMEEYDEDDVLEYLEDGTYYTTKDEKEIKKMCKDDYLSGVKAKNLSSLFVGGKVDEDNNEMFIVYSLKFKDKDSAEKTFENFVEGLEEQEDQFKKYYDKDSFKTDSDDDFFAMAFDDGWGEFEYYEIIMDDAKTISIIVAVISSDDDVYDEYQEFYEAIERDCPSDMLKNEPSSKK